MWTIPLFTLSLTPDQPCNWQEISQLLQSWNPAIQPAAGSTKNEALFTTKLPTGEQERLTSLIDLQQLLKPHGISFSLEIKP